MQKKYEIIRLPEVVASIPYDEENGYECGVIEKRDAEAIINMFFEFERHRFESEEHTLEEWATLIGESFAWRFQDLFNTVK